MIAMLATLTCLSGTAGTLTRTEIRTDTRVDATEESTQQVSGRIQPLDNRYYLLDGHRVRWPGLRPVLIEHLEIQPIVLSAENDATVASAIYVGTGIGILIGLVVSATSHQSSYFCASCGDFGSIRQRWVSNVPAGMTISMVSALGFIPAIMLRRKSRLKRDRSIALFNSLDLGASP